MGLSCSCDDFDKGDSTSWWEPGRRAVPPAGTRCCECAAPLPAGEPCQTILHGEVYDPGEIDAAPRDFQPRHSVTCDVLNRHLEQIEAAHEDDMDAWRDRHGWDSDYERFERFTTDYRCERCEGLADAIEDLGYCMILPGELSEAHTEYVEQSGAPEMIWKRGGDGVWHPRRMTRADFARREMVRMWNRARGFVWYGGWRSWLRYTVWAGIERRTVAPVMRELGYRRIYDHAFKRMRWHHGPDGSGMEWVCTQIAACGYHRRWDTSQQAWVWTRDDAHAGEASVCREPPATILIRGSCKP